MYEVTVVGGGPAEAWRICIPASWAPRSPVRAREDELVSFAALRIIRELSLVPVASDQHGGQERFSAAE